MSTEEVLASAKRVLEGSDQLLKALDDAPGFVQSNENVVLAKELTIEARLLVIELYKRVKAEITKGSETNGEQGSETSTGVQALS